MSSEQWLQLYLIMNSSSIWRIDSIPTVIKSNSLLTVYRVKADMDKTTYSYFSHYLIGSSSYNIESQSVVFSV